MAWVRYSHAEISATRPRALGTCDRCGAVYNHDRLQWQWQYQGPRLQNLKILVCSGCLDVPQPQLRTIILPPDPVPILNPRPENYTADNNPVSTIGADPLLSADAGGLNFMGGLNFGILCMGGGINAAFDSNINKPLVLCASFSPSQIGYENTIGKVWNGIETQPAPLGTHEVQTYTVSRFVMYAPNDAPFFTSGAISYRLEGSNDDGTTWTSLASGTTAGTIGEVIDTTVSGGAYALHEINFSGNGTGTIAVAQLQLYASA